MAARKYIAKREVISKLTALEATIEGGLTGLVAQIQREFPGMDFSALERVVGAALSDVREIVATHKEKIHAAGKE
jgi:hypothetical protein